MEKAISSSSSAKECGHNGCSLINTEGCCACLDKRPVTKSYELYVDGQGITTDTDYNARYRHYCPSCRSGMNLPHVWQVTGGSVNDAVKQRQIRMDRYERRAARREAKLTATRARLPPVNPTTSVSEELKPEIPAPIFRPVERHSLFGRVSRAFGPSTSSRNMEQRYQQLPESMSHVSRQLSNGSTVPPGYLSVDVPDSAPPPYTPREGVEPSPSQSDQKPDRWADDPEDDSRGSTHGNRRRWWTFLRQ